MVFRVFLADAELHYDSGETNRKAITGWSPPLARFLRRTYYIRLDIREFVGEISHLIRVLVDVIEFSDARALIEDRLPAVANTANLIPRGEVDDIRTASRGGQGTSHIDSRRVLDDRGEYRQRSYRDGLIHRCRVRPRAR